MVNTKRTKRSPMPSHYQITDADREKWSRMPKRQEKCKRMWRQGLVADAKLDKLCRDDHGEYKYDPIAMTISCLNDPAKYEHETNPVWVASLKVAKFHLRFRSYMMSICHKHGINFLIIRQTCDPIRLD
jgi:hypothetical protein